jgi:hypothetical protein
MTKSFIKKCSGLAALTAVACLSAGCSDDVAAPMAQEGLGEIRLTAAKIRNVMPAQKEIAAMSVQWLDNNLGKDAKGGELTIGGAITAMWTGYRMVNQYDDVVRKHGFYSMQDFTNAQFTLLAIVEGCMNEPAGDCSKDPSLQRRAEIEEQIAVLKNQEGMTTAEKQPMIDAWMAEIGNLRPVKYPENLVLVQSMKTEIKAILTQNWGS